MSPHSLVSAGRKLGLLAVPPPYRSWLTISNDPDFTTIERWRQLHQLIWEELQLPFADAFFISNHNETLPEQVNVQDYPEILQAHPHDTMHTWGDFQDCRSHRFCREDAVQGCEILRHHDIVPRVWTDHSNFSGNLIHRASRKAVPVSVDSSGHEYPNFEYMLDLVRAAGVRYIWDGKLTKTIGQDRHVSLLEWYTARSSNRWISHARAVADLVAKPLWKVVDARAFDYVPVNNRQYEPHSFPDGQTFYRFARFGQWPHADIDGLSKVLARDFIDRLLTIGGTCVVYTHLGKPRADRVDDPQHVPPSTVQALEYLALLYRQQDLMLSGTARLIDYLVLRDHVVVGDRIDFRPDGVRFETLTPTDLAGFSFGVQSDSGNIEVSCLGVPTPCRIEQFGKRIYCITFPGKGE